MELTGDLERNYEHICARIEATGRSTSELTIVAVTKFQPDESIGAAYEIGLRNFGENYLEGLLRRERFDHLTDARWHFIGGIQRNKLKQIIANADVIQTVDREALLPALHASAQRPDLLVQVNLAEGPTRSGCSWDEAPHLIEKAKGEGLEIRGLMGIGPLDREESRRAFRRLAQMAKSLELSEVSVGMSEDFEVALEEGATMLRLGTALFGARPHSSR